MTTIKPEKAGEMNPATLGGALVTGAGKRLGRSIALGLAAAGWDVAVHFHHSADEAQQVVREIQALNRRAVSLGADLSDEASVIALFEQASEQAGPDYLPGQ